MKQNYFQRILRKMKKIIVLGHGGYAEGVKQNLEMIVGPQDNMYFEDLTKDDDLCAFEGRVNAIVNSLKDEVEILFACDLLGASPFRVAAMLSAQSNGKYYTVAGLNTMAYIDASMNLEGELSIEELAIQSMNTAKEAIAKFPE